MTATTTTELPDYKGEKVTGCTIKFSGLGTGFNGLDIQPIAMELEDEAFFVIRVVNHESPSHKHDKDGHLVRNHRVRAEEMAPISKELAGKVLQEYAAVIEKAKAELDGQASLDEELAAQEREKADGTDSPEDIAAGSAERVKAGK